MRRPRALFVLGAVGLIAIAVAYLVIPSFGRSSARYWPTHGWRVDAPETEGFDSAHVADALFAIREKNLPIHSLLIVRDGTLVLDATFYPYDGSTPHDLASVTKTVTTTLIGIAAAQGKLSPDDRMVSFFSERSMAHRDDRKNRITVRQLASMSSGLDCSADGNEQALREMQNSVDPIQFALDLPMAAEPGSRFAYCSPGMHLLSAIIQKATGMSELEFARRYLFGPLGIETVIWPSDRQGYTHGWGDLRLLPRDAAKIGYLWAREGEWEGRQMISRQWVEESLSVQMKTGQGDDYGYGWWLPRDTATGEYAAIGRGGQRIAVHRKLDGVIVITGAGVEPDVVTDLIAPALVDPGRALPSSQPGMSRLRDALTAIGGPDTHRVPPLPKTAELVSGQTWAFGPNDEGLETVKLGFARDEGSIRMTFSDGRPPLAARIGLDGAYRISAGPTGLPAGFRGSWTNDRTFGIEFDEIAADEAFELQLRFDGDRLVVDGRERTTGVAFVLVARRQRA